MRLSKLNWLLHSDGGLLARIAAGCAIFAVMAAVELKHKKAEARRWREYGILLAAVAAALIYGAVNDQITVTISPEYFLYGKELSRNIGEHPPMGQLRWEAAKVGFKATWSAGLIFGVMLLIANNPFGSIRRLQNRQLVVYLPFILLVAGACGAVGGWLGYHDFLDRLDSDFEDILAANMYRPHRFICCWGVHLGGYVGGLVGAVMAVFGIIRRRMKLTQMTSAAL